MGRHARGVAGDPTGWRARVRAWGERVRAAGRPATRPGHRPLRLVLQVAGALVGVAALGVGISAVILIAGRHALGALPVSPLAPTVARSRASAANAGHVTATAGSATLAAPPASALTPPPVTSAASAPAVQTTVPASSSGASHPAEGTPAKSTGTAGGTASERPAAASPSGSAARSSDTAPAAASGTGTGPSRSGSGSAAQSGGVPEAPPPQMEPPVPGGVLAPFGWAFSTVFGAWQEHTGVDLAADVGARVGAPAAGVVTAVRSDPLWGWVVSLALNGTYSTNISALGTVVVAKGQTVSAGAELGTVGASPPAEANLPSHVFWQLFAGTRPLNPEPA